MNQCNKNCEGEIFFDFSANIETGKIDLKPTNPNCLNCLEYQECVSGFFTIVEESVERVLKS